MDGRAPLSDWRDGAAYEHLLRAERAGFAWEWLRRKPDYQKASLDHLDDGPQNPGGVCSDDPDAARWGLHRFENPALAVPSARPVWRADRFRFVLRAIAEPSLADGDALTLDALDVRTLIICTSVGECLLLSNGFRSIRLDVSGVSSRGGPMRLHYDLHGFAAADAPLLVLRQLRALVATGNFSPSLHRPDRRARRSILLLRAHDALAAGATQRAIAVQLLGSSAARERWRVQAPSLRSQAQRLVRGARHMADAGLWGFLG